jgi:DNA-binding MarR family transcriptional regulator
VAKAKRESGALVKAHETAHLYAAEPESSAGSAVIVALQLLGQAAHQAEDRAVINLGMNHADALATRYLLQADRDGQHLSPTDLSKLLGMTTAASSKLVNRLVEAGRAERRPHPTDKRAQIITPTPEVHADFHASYALIHTPLVEIVNNLSLEESSTIVRFAKQLTAALLTAPIFPTERPDDADSPDDAV